MSETLDKLFGSAARVKVMRFFLRNPEKVFTLFEVSRTLGLPRARAQKETTFLSSLGFLRKGTKEVEFSFKGKKRLKKKRVPGLFLHSLFPYVRELRSLLVQAVPLSRELLAKRFRRLGRGLKLVILSGIFVKGQGEDKVDVLVVGDTIRKSRVENILGKMEAQLGKELTYAFLSTEEFRYRKGMYDRFVTDILESEHEVLIDNLK